MTNPRSSTAHVSKYRVTSTTARSPGAMQERHSRPAPLASRAFCKDYLSAFLGGGRGGRPHPPLDFRICDLYFVYECVFDGHRLRTSTRSTLIHNLAAKSIDNMVTRLLTRNKVVMRIWRLRTPSSRRILLCMSSAKPWLVSRKSMSAGACSL